MILYSSSYLSHSADEHKRPPNMPDLLLTCTLFREGGTQLAGPAMIKAQPNHTIARVAGAFCRWAVIPLEQCLVQFNGNLLDSTATVAGAGLGSGSAVVFMIAAEAPDPSASARSAPFAMIDVRNELHRPSLA